jgi:hypothetical protein
MDNGKTQNANGDFGFAFVGSYLNQCARVEAWTITMLAAHEDKTSKSKVPHLFGQKLKAVRELADSHPEVFNKPSRVVALMQQFEEPAKLRSNLAHSIMHKTCNPSGSFYLFHNTGTAERFWFTEEDMNTSLSSLKKIVKEITDQKPKSTPPPSPLQPKQAAAAGP